MAPMLGKRYRQPPVAGDEDQRLTRTVATGYVRFGASQKP